MKIFHIQENYSFFNCFMPSEFFMKIRNSEIKPFPKLGYETVKSTVLKALRDYRHHHVHGQHVTFQMQQPLTSQEQLLQSMDLEFTKICQCESQKHSVLGKVIENDTLKMPDSL